MLKIKNTSEAYGLVSIMTHWLLALLMIFMLGLGWYITTINYYHPNYHFLFDLHRSLGVITFVVAFFHLVWFITNKLPRHDHLNQFEQYASKIMHWCLIIMTLLIPMSGYLLSTSAGDAVSVFGLFTIPALWQQGHPYEELTGKIHAILGYTTMGLVGLHVAAALKHAIINHDGILGRMLGRTPKP